ncbi:alpha/beta hydrolase [Actinacidiphila acididurans]|uniref:Dienelactone hydrolase family protein n=1 Tax=Actinacidiphila acididurans TaxID=2784346 RepID=A0ABS2TWK9_9ACTN|nr:alpha/beta hydrolase [Actinacidiphila acididurans]MBM9507726.1 dienelactone hydrolase family protein [Actinacidiphila acididurans]
MTAYVLVPDVHTGGWVWERTAALLREAGAAAYPVTLTGMGDPGRPAGPDTTLDTHIADVVRAIDGTGDPQVVLVGHGYGIHPALGAADLRPARVARVVHLDAGLPKDGDPPLALIPDPSVREASGGSVSAGEWERWGSTAGVPAEDLARLTERAAPQPMGTLTQPLRRTGAAHDVPTTGVLCTAGGGSIARVEAMIAMGDPHLAQLTAPGVTFFELPTGHWPMLSAPADLVRVLLSAAAGEGHRITRRRPTHLRPFLLDVPDLPRERRGRVDLYVPNFRGEHVRGSGGRRAEGADVSSPDDAPDAAGTWPAVVFVHGGPVPEAARPTPRDWPSLTGYARLVASYGAVGAIVDHRLHGLGDWERAAADVAEAVAAVRADPRVDPDRIALWYFSAGGLLAADVLAAPPPWLRCVSASYPVLAPLPGWGLAGSRFHPAEAVLGAGRLPLVLTRVGAERPELAATVAHFTAAARACGAALEIIDVPGAPHGFETAEPSESAKGAVLSGVRTVLGHLGVAP